MSEYLAAAAQVLSAPEVIVQRSAEARAKATGAEVDSILQAWAGGEAVAAPPVAAPAAAPGSADPPPPPAAESAPAPASPTAAMAQPAAVAVMEAPPVEVELVEAASLSDRMRAATRVGAVSGLLLSLLGWVFSAQYLIGRAGTTGTEGEISVVVGVDAGRLIVIAMLISVAIGIVVAGLVRMLPSWTSPGMKLTGSALPSVALGAILGGLIGALAGGIVAGLGTPPELPGDPTTVPVLSAVIWAVLVWVAGGWLIGALVQALGVPDGVDTNDVDEVAVVRGRLVAAFGLPVVVGLSILVLVLSFAFVFISFPSYSPLTGTVLAGSILGFASLSASKPNMKVGLNELMVAAAGMGVVVILIYAVLQTTGAGGHEEEAADHAETTESTVEP